MTQHSRDTPQFYLTAPSPCPYLEGQEERKVFTHLVGERAGELNDLLTHGGFRRSQSIAYRPACEGCRACISVRVVAADFAPSRNMRRIAERNADMIGDMRLTLYLLWGVVAVVLLIACANTATLLLGKATVRTREIAVRTVLGASRGRIVRQMITESFVLALVAGALGLMLAAWGVRVLTALTPADVVRLAGTGIDRGVLLFTLGVTMATSVLFGLIPALHASRVDLIDAIKQGGAGAVSGARMIRTRSLLVVSEIALAVVLLTGAGLLVKSLVALHRAELGFQSSNVLVMKATGIRSPQENNTFFREVMSRIGALPGVVAVGATSIPPADLSHAGDSAYFIDRMPEKRDRTHDSISLDTIVAPGTFAALGIPLRSGRDFDERDAADRPLVAIVNEALVRKSLAGVDPVGRTIFCTFDRKEGMTIVGVVGDVPQRNPAIAPVPECYMPYTQHSYNNWTLNVVARTAGDPMALAGTVRRLAAEVSPDVPVSFTTMDATMAKSVEIRDSARCCSDARRSGRLSRDGRRLRRDGVCRAAAIEGDRPADGAGLEPWRRAASHSAAGSAAGRDRPGARSGRRRRGHTAPGDHPVRGPAGRRRGLPRRDRAVRRGDAGGRLSSGAPRRRRGSGESPQGGLRGDPRLADHEGPIRGACVRW